jgi:hypothetical protein
MKTPAFIFLAFMLAFIACRHDALEPAAGVDPPVIPPASPPSVDTICYFPVGLLVQASDPGPQTLLIDSAAGVSITFEIGSLSPGHYARAIPANCQLLDRSMYGYATALHAGDTIGPGTGWQSTHSHFVLGTSVGHAGQFEGQGDRYLGFRFPGPDTTYRYGWVLLHCNSGNTVVHVKSFAYRKNPATPLRAGQETPGQTFDTLATRLAIDEIASVFGDYRDHADPDSAFCTFHLLPTPTLNRDFKVQYFSFIWPFVVFEGYLGNGELEVPLTTWDVDVPNTNYSYAGSFRASGVLYEQNGLRFIEWDVDYDNVGQGVPSSSYHGAYRVYLCP